MKAQGGAAVYWNSSDLTGFHVGVSEYNNVTKQQQNFTYKLEW